MTASKVRRKVTASEVGKGRRWKGECEPAMLFNLKENCGGGASDRGVVIY